MIADDTAAFVYRIKIDAIKWQMRLDLKHVLDDFAARWGIER